MGEWMVFSFTFQSDYHDYWLFVFLLTPCTCILFLSLYQVLGLVATDEDIEFALDTVKQYAYFRVFCHATLIVNHSVAYHSSSFILAYIAEIAFICFFGLIDFLSFFFQSGLSR